MINGKTVIAVIPARGGSKGLPRKNVLPLCGKPLIAWTIEKAVKSDHLDLVLVSTDSPEIAEVAKRHRATVPFLRPAELATDKASSYDVIRHALDYCRTAQGRDFDYVVLLEPTSPLREDDDVDRMLETLDEREDEFDAIVSVGEVTLHPSIMKRRVGDGLEADTELGPVSTAPQFERVGELIIHYVEQGPPDAPVLLMLHSLGTNLHAVELGLKVKREKA